MIKHYFNFSLYLNYNILINKNFSNFEIFFSIPKIDAFNLHTIVYHFNLIISDVFRRGKKTNCGNCL